MRNDELMDSGATRFARSWESTIFEERMGFEVAVRWPSPGYDARFCLSADRSCRHQLCKSGAGSPHSHLLAHRSLTSSRRGQIPHCHVPTLSD